MPFAQSYGPQGIGGAAARVASGGIPPPPPPVFLGFSSVALPSAAPAAGPDVAWFRTRRRARGADLRRRLNFTSRFQLPTRAVVAVPRRVTAGGPRTGLGVRLEPLPRVFLIPQQLHQQSIFLLCR